MINLVLHHHAAHSETEQVATAVPTAVPMTAPDYAEHIDIWSVQEQQRALHGAHTLICHTTTERHAQTANDV
jgi:hypothetical protein